jgi:hypothetical protein
VARKELEEPMEEWPLSEGDSDSQKEQCKLNMGWNLKKASCNQLKLTGRKLFV